MKTVIIGGDAAGMSAAMQIRRRQPDWQVVVFEKGPDTSYGACGIPYFFGGEVEHLDALVVMTPADFAKEGVTVHAEHEVLAVWPEKKQIQVRQANGKTFCEDYDKLLIATGAQAILPDWPGLELDGVLPVKTLVDSRRLEAHLQKGCQSVVIIGGGYIGLEMAEGLQKRGLKVTVLEKTAGLMGNLHPEMSAEIVAELKAHDVEVHLEVAVEGFAGKAGHVTQVLTDQGSFDAELVIVSLGVRPNVDFLEGSGVALGETGALAVNAYQETAVPDIYAAGDCAEAFHRVLKKPVHIPLALTANRQGRVAGAHMCGDAERFPGVLGTAVTKVFDYVVARTGLDVQTAKAEGIPFELAEETSGNKAKYYSGHASVRVQLLYHRETHKLLGALLTGKDPSLGKRADIVATAISADMDILAFSDLDLAYAPPFSPVWDPVLQAANQARFRILD